MMAALPALSLFAFHLTWPGATRDDEDRATRELLERVARRGRVFLTGCATEGRYLARVCVLSFRTRQQHIDACVEDVTCAARAILSQAK